MTAAVIVAGGGVVRDGMAGALRELARRTGTGVLNTWTAKGLFPWDSLAHLGTIGLQARDVELAGLADVDDVVLVGVDDGELPRRELDAAGVRWREVPTHAVGDLDVPVRTEPTPRPALYGALAAVCGPLYADDTLPSNPARAAADLAGWLPSGGVVCGEWDIAGFWLGRTFPTRELGSVALPSSPVPGFAATAAATARRAGRPSVAVVSSLGAATQAVLARTADLVVEVWTAEGPPLSSADRLARLDDLVAGGGRHVVELGIDLRPLAALEGVAGALRFLGGNPLTGADRPGNRD